MADETLMSACVCWPLELCRHLHSNQNEETNCVLLFCWFML